MYPMKRLLTALIAFIMLFACGCDAKQGSTGESAITEYLEFIRTGDYGAAWDMLSAASRNETEATKSTSITRAEFIKKYEGIFTALEVTSIEYEGVTAEGGEILCLGTYTATYRSDYTGDLTNDFRITARREGGEWTIEWTPALIFPDMEWGDTVRVARLSASRGEILADGERLAATVGATTVYASPSAITDRALFTTQVSRLLGVTEDSVTKALSKEYDDVAVLAEFYSDELSASLEEQLLAIDGVGIDYGNFSENREYPYGSTLAHLIGYVGVVPNESEEALKETLDKLNEGRTEADGLYTSDSRIGRVGLELQYEQELRGRDGEMVYIRTAEGTNRQTLYKREAEDGYDLELTIDTKLQQKLERTMELVLFGDTTAGAVIVINPKTGAVEAMCSYPSYDLNLFTRGISGTDYASLLNDAAKPLINRTTQGLYPPGSTMKVFTASAALDLSVLDESYVFDESQIKEDYWQPTEYGEWIWTPIKRTHINYPISGKLNMRKAFIHSDNIYFANCALMTGWEPFMEYMDNLGFTEAIDFDIGVASPQLYNEGTEQTYKLLADSGYGQGEILITPLQLACLFASLENGGDVPTPYVVEGVYKEEGIKYDLVTQHPDAPWRTDVISDAAIATITPMLEDVVDPELNGTGRKLRVKSCTVAAKTGTAEIGNDKSREISWFAGFRTGVSEEDERLVLVMLEIPADEDYTSLKFDIAREMLEIETN